MSNFHVGQKVVLVHEEPVAGKGVPRREALRLGAIYPVKGRVYTVRGIWHASEEILLLGEIDNSHVAAALSQAKEPGFASWRFRPVVSRPTDISIFKAMLNPQNEQVTA